MKKKEAVRILKEQLDKLDDEKNHNYNWLLETRVYIDSFFGKGSRQSDNFKHTRFNLSPSMGITEQKNIENIKVSIQNCINIINNLGIYKEPKKNILSRISDGMLALILTGLSAFFFIIAEYTSDVQNIELKMENKILTKKIDSLKNSKPLFIPPSSDQYSDKTPKDSIPPIK